jgi:5'-nucleotidase
MNTILVTNDDGIESAGIMVLTQALAQIGKIITIAPDRDNSAVSHSLTMNRPLLVKKNGPDSFAVDGTPTDCVAIGIHKILHTKPDLLVSGINAGPNLGDDISYSGTVSAAVEGTMYSIPSMAVSLAGTSSDYSNAAKIAVELATIILARGLPENTLLNVNIPSEQKIRGIRVTRQGRRLWQDSIQETFDPWGKKFYWIGGGTPVKDSATDTDAHAIEQGYVSVTPIHLDMTNHEGVFHLKDDWQLEKDINW